MNWENGSFLVSTDPGLLQLDRVHAFLSSCYWAKGIPFDLMEKSVRNSLAFGLYQTWRGRGLSKWLMSCVREHPELQGLRRFCLGTRDAHGLYRQFGFEVIRQPENWMEIKITNPYPGE